MDEENSRRNFLRGLVTAAVVVGFDTRLRGWVKTPRALKKSRGISCSFGWLGVGMTMPKSRALPSNFGCTVNVSTFASGSQVINAFCAGWAMSASFAEK